MAAAGLTLGRVTRGLDVIRTGRVTVDDPTASAEVLGRHDGCGRRPGPARTRVGGVTAAGEGRDLGCELDRLHGGLDAGRFVPAPLGTGSWRVTGARALVVDLCRARSVVFD